MTLRCIALLFCTLTLLMACQNQQNTPTDGGKENMATADTLLWVGTYTRKEGHVDGKAEGIYALQYPGMALQHTQASIVNPSYLTLHPNGKSLYAVSELGPGADASGLLYAYQIIGDSLALLTQMAVPGWAPCYVAVDAAGRFAAVASYAGGIALYPLAADGSLLPAADTVRFAGKGSTPRQEASHPHAAVFSPDGRWLLCTDLGLDKIHIFELNDDGFVQATPASIDMPQGAGPRHLVFHPQHPEWVYVMNELNNTLAFLHFDAATGSLRLQETASTLPADFKGDSLGSDLHITPDGRFLYAANRGHNSLAGFAIAPDTGQPSPIGHTPCGGDFPRNFLIMPDGRSVLVANQNSGNIVQFRLDTNTGALQQQSTYSVKTPVCLQVQIR